MLTIASVPLFSLLVLFVNHVKTERELEVVRSPCGFFAKLRER